MWHLATSCKVKFAQNTHVFAHQLIQPGSWDDLELLLVCFPVFYPLSVAFQEVSLSNELLVKSWPPYWIFNFFGILRWLAWKSGVTQITTANHTHFSRGENWTRCSRVCSRRLTKEAELCNAFDAAAEGGPWGAGLEIAAVETPVYFLSFLFHAVFKRSYWIWRDCFSSL